MSLLARLPLIVMLVAATAAAQDQPSPQVVLDKAIEAAGGLEALAALGTLELDIEDQETRESGETTVETVHAYVDCTSLTNLRLELPRDLVLVREGDSGWATIRGTLDDRPSTPAMARGTVHQRLVPVLLPFSLALPGVSPIAAEETEFEGQPAWKLKVEFPETFFMAPVISNTWSVYVGRQDYRLLAAEFMPPAKYAELAGEGMRYRPIKRQELGGVTLTDQLMTEGIVAGGAATPHVRISTISAAKLEGWDPSLFLNPDKLEALDEGDVFN